MPSGCPPRFTRRRNLHGIGPGAGLLQWHPPAEIGIGQPCRRGVPAPICALGVPPVLGYIRKH